MSVHQLTPPTLPEPYVTIDELAELMGVSRSTIKRWRKDGLPCETWGVRVIRFRPTQVMTWARARRLA